jgi:ParB family chromosome partitioning protein
MVENVPVIQMISVDAIAVVNPRARNKKTFKEIVENIAGIGLKRPITVARRKASDGTHQFDLVCGQGRLEAFRNLGQTEIPAVVVEADTEDCMVMSLVENLARRQHRAIDLLYDIQGLKGRGYNDTQIATKTGLSLKYVKGVIRLLDGGEHRLLRAVESGHIPASVAVEIAEADDEGVQKVLQEAYENKTLRGNRLSIAKRLIEQRRRRGKGLRTHISNKKRDKPLSPEAILRAYRDDANKKRLLVRRADATRDRIVFITEALRKLFADENFVTLLRAEGLETLPRNIADRLQNVTGN